MESLGRQQEYALEAANSMPALSLPRAASELNQDRLAPRQKYL
jgi:hypothetical protein